MVEIHRPSTISTRFLSERQRFSNQEVRRSLPTQSGAPGADFERDLLHCAANSYCFCLNLYRSNLSRGILQPSASAQKCYGHRTPDTRGLALSALKGDSFEYFREWSLKFTEKWGNTPIVNPVPQCPNESSLSMKERSRVYGDRCP